MKKRFFFSVFPIGISIGNPSHVPEVVIYVMIGLKFAGYIATVMVPSHPKFYGNRSITFRVISFYVFCEKIGPAIYSPREFFSLKDLAKI